MWNCPFGECTYSKEYRSTSKAAQSDKRISSDLLFYSIFWFSFSILWYCVCGERRTWSDYVDAQPDLGIRCPYFFPQKHNVTWRDLIILLVMFLLFSLLQKKLGCQALSGLTTSCRFFATFTGEICFDILFVFLWTKARLKTCVLKNNGKNLRSTYIRNHFFAWCDLWKDLDKQLPPTFCISYW